MLEAIKSDVSTTLPDLKQSLVLSHEAALRHTLIPFETQADLLAPTFSFKKFIQIVKEQTDDGFQGRLFFLVLLRDQVSEFLHSSAAGVVV